MDQKRSFLHYPISPLRLCFFRLDIEQVKKYIPNYELLGEMLSGGHVDPIHFERIRDRSIHLDWTIRLHRHSRLAQIFLLKTEGVSLRIGDVDYLSTEPILLIIPPGLPHGFRFPEDMEGSVLSFRVETFDAAFQSRLSAFENAATTIHPKSQTPSFTKIEALMGQLMEVYDSVSIERKSLLRLLTDLIVTFLSADRNRDRDWVPVRPGGLDTLSLHEQQAEQFCGLVDIHFKEPWSVSDYAVTIGVSAPHLSRVARRVLGSSPNGFVRQRRLLEAKRLLEFTRLSIAEIATRAGFQDPAFFSRSFRKMVGLAPQAYRAQQERLP